MRLATGELQSLASRSSLNRAWARYRKCRKFESLFGALKTRGFNLEATHMADPVKLSTLIALLTLAAAFACRAGLALASITAIRRKTHGKPARSLFDRDIRGLLLHGIEIVVVVFPVELC
jgi:hypothetical protein